MKKLLITFGSAILLSACSHTPTAADIDKQNAGTQAVQQSESTVATEGSLATASVEIASFAFSPKTITVKPEDAYGTDPSAHPLGNKTLFFKVQVVSVG